MLFEWWVSLNFYVLVELVIYFFSFCLLIWYILIIPSWNITNFFIIHFSCLNYAWLDLVFWYYSGFFFSTYVQESDWSVILSSCYFFFFFGNWGYVSFTEWIGVFSYLLCQKSLIILKRFIPWKSWRLSSREDLCLPLLRAGGTAPGCSGPRVVFQWLYSINMFISAQPYFSVCLLFIARCLLWFQLVVSALKILITLISFFVSIRKNMCICYSCILHFSGRVSQNVYFAIMSEKDSVVLI